MNKVLYYVIFYTIGLKIICRFSARC